MPTWQRHYLSGSLHPHSRYQLNCEINLNCLSPVLGESVTMSKVLPLVSILSLCEAFIFGDLQK